MLGILGDWLLELLATVLTGFSLIGDLSTVQKGARVDVIDQYLLGLLKHSKLITPVEKCSVSICSKTKFICTPDDDVPRLLITENDFL